MYAVIKTGGKQYRVAQDQVIKVERIPGEKGDAVKLDQVLAISNGKELLLGEPTIKDVVVSAEILEHKRTDKVIIFKKKRRHNYRRKKGHRQNITVLRVMDVSGEGKVIAKAPKAEKKEAEVAASA